MQKVGIFGYGKIKNFLHDVYKNFKEEFEINNENLDVLNICIPFDDEDNFINSVIGFMENSNPKITIIYSNSPNTTISLIRKIAKLPVSHCQTISLNSNVFMYEKENEKNLTESHFEKLKIKFKSIKVVGCN